MRICIFSKPLRIERSLKYDYKKLDEVIHKYEKHYVHRARVIQILVR